MPVKKINKKTAQPMGGCCDITLSKKVSRCQICKMVFGALFAILLVYGIVYMGILIRNGMQEFNYIGQADRMERSINIQGEGRVTAKPDVAVTTMGTISEGQTVAEAQAGNTEIMNTLVSKLKSLGILEDDIQTTNYNIYPQYNYTSEKGRELSGYQVTQNVTVKMRDLGKANQVLALAGEVGANNVSGLEFTIDDREVYKDKAREAALEDAGKKAKMLSESLGVKMVSVVSYDEYEGGGYDYEPYRALAYEGLGGGMAPDIESGSMEVVMNINITFEIR